MPVKRKKPAAKRKKKQTGGATITIKLSRAQLKKILGGKAKGSSCAIHETVQSSPRRVK